MLAQHPVHALAYILHLTVISCLLPVSLIFIQIYSTPELYYIVSTWSVYWVNTCCEKHLHSPSCPNQEHTAHPSLTLTPSGQSSSNSYYQFYFLNMSWVHLLFSNSTATKLGYLLATQLPKLVCLSPVLSWNALKRCILCAKAKVIFS